MPELLVDCRAQLSIVRHAAGCPTLLAQVRTRWPDETARVLTDNGSCYRSHTFAKALGAVEHRRTRPYRTQTNGKERLHRTLADEWTYARLYHGDGERCQAFTTWLHTYNHHRGHTALRRPTNRQPRS